ncbi:oligosaccharide flippase family protein [Latilactobacillus curvatus]|uniref:oligosaccharide flippase family protein n=1 Tax=Latilactobacillus curvatus TaxID=28038 RepID=UPI0020A317C5|nr:oligosaccharide flippase family protein [Latilactobacillus curvatus]UTC12785.1 capsular biosynthesis protein [Latilactobacillus curvatus]
MKKLFKDFFYNAIYQVFLVIIPLITAPYLSRILGPGPLGINSSVNFTIQFIMVFCAAAMGQIGIRTIARAKANKDQAEFEAAFWGLWLIQATLSAITITIFVVVCLVFKPRYYIYFLLQLPFLLGTLIDISWFFQGIAEFRKVVVRNTIIKLFSVVLIFVFVHQPSDLGLYMLIMSMGNLLGNSVFWFQIKKYVPHFVGHYYHFRTTIVVIITLVIPQLATQIYTSLDKPILGLFKSTTQVSYYDQSQRIANIILSVITSITIVMMPKMAASSDESRQIFLKKSYEATLALGLAFMVTIMCNTKQFVPWFFGAQFAPMTPLVFFMSFLIVLLPVGEVFSNQFALAIRKDKEFAIPLIIGAILSLILNFTLDPILGAVGATITILSVQSVVCLLRIWIVRKDYDAQYVLRDTPKYLILAGVTFVIGFMMPDLIPNVFLNMAFKSILILGIYMGLFWIGKFELATDVRQIIGNIIDKRRK